LFVGVSALALALAAKMARRSLISALRRAMAKRWSSGVALVSPLGCSSKLYPPLWVKGLSCSLWNYQVTISAVVVVVVVTAVVVVVVGAAVGRLGCL
jgi:hypothetical protein